MDILGFAKKIEKEGYEHYRELAKTVKSKELAGIFKFLADEEEKHYRLFDAFQGTQYGPISEEKDRNNEDIIKKAKAVFKSLSKDINNIAPEDASEDVYKKAISLEKNSISFYQDALKEDANFAQRKTIEIILDEEIKHLETLKNISDFMKGPKEWVENAEWYHLDEY